MSRLDDALAEQAKAEAELAEALAALARAEEACKAAGVSIAKPRPSRAKARPARGVHHPESGLRSGIWGSGPAPVGDRRVRIDESPVVIKEFDPSASPDEYKYVGRECLYIADVMDGRPESDSWRRCKCASCGSIN